MPFVYTVYHCAICLHRVPLHHLKHPLTDTLAQLVVPEPPSNRQLAKARRKRIYEKHMWNVIKEIAWYFAFLILTSFIAWGPMDDSVYLMNSRIKHLYDGSNGTYKYTAVSTLAHSYGHDLSLRIPDHPHSDVLKSCIWVTSSPRALTLHDASHDLRDGEDLVSRYGSSAGGTRTFVGG